MFSLICTRINGLRRHRAHYGATVMSVVFIENYKQYQWDFINSFSFESFDNLRLCVNNQESLSRWAKQLALAGTLYNEFYLRTYLHLLECVLTHRFPNPVRRFIIWLTPSKELCFPKQFDRFKIQDFINRFLGHNPLQAFALLSYVIVCIYIITYFCYFFCG